MCQAISEGAHLYTSIMSENDNERAAQQDTSEPQGVKAFGSSSSLRSLRASAVSCLRAARETAFARLSNYQVGAAVITATGKVFSGANLELGTTPRETIHAEQSAVALAYVYAPQDRVLAVMTEGGHPYVFHTEKS